MNWEVFGVFASILLFNDKVIKRHLFALETST